MDDDAGRVAWSGIETLLNAARAQLSEAQVNNYLNEVAAVSGHNIREARPWYPISAHNVMLDLLGERCYPNLKAAERDYNLGLAAFDAYKQTTIGRVTTSAISAIGPYKTLERVCKQLGQTFSPGTCRINQLAANRYQVVISGPHIHPAYIEGYLRSMLIAGGAQRLAVKAGSPARDQISFEVGWA